MDTQEPKSNRSYQQNFHIKEQEIREVGSKSGRKRDDSARPACAHSRAPVCPCASGRKDSLPQETFAMDRPDIEAYHSPLPVTHLPLKKRIRHWLRKVVKSVGNALISISAFCLTGLARFAHRLQGKVDCKDLAKGMSALGRSLFRQLKEAPTIEGIFQPPPSPSAQNALAKQALANPRSIADLKEIEDTPLSPPLLAAAILSLARLYIDLAAAKKLLHPQNPAMHRAFLDVQEAMQWLVSHKEKSKMCWIGLAISSLPFFKTMRLENYPLRFQGATPLEEEFLSLVIDKLAENPVDLQRELMLVPLMTEFAHADDMKKRQLIDSLKVLDV
ncbi:hypothetical protein [Estrella lausannensis]|uniref:Putative membrane protein n=1 Tax=Estrella lausannensis TaxID=483423 RepID=A0A0H5E428_9BACT|nr:hypothetical protein [Estrella lausannensis]CRX37980.1 putative membrane protein [Estrella lausannensis]